MDLKALRHRINELDDKLMSAYIERTELVKKVADYKKQNGIAILNKNREKEVIERLINKFGKEYKQDIYSLYPSIMNISKLRQARENKKTDIKKVIGLKECKDKGNMSGLKIAVQGVEGAYSMLAAREMFIEPEISYNKSFEDVFQAVAEGKTEFGVVPIENSNAGSVNEVYDLLAKYKLFIAKARQHKIEHCLIGNFNTKKEDIETVISHPQALYQCKNYLHKNSWDCVTKGNTAVAAEEISRTKENKIAAIASEYTAKRYNLKIIEKCVQDEEHNYTRFIAITKDNIAIKKANKISLVAALEHKEGSLFQLLNIVASYNVNMTKLESRPIPGSSFEFLFYFDVTGNIMDEDIQNMLIDIYEYSNRVIYLGGYLEQ